jgi:site-specific recombinase XerD
MSAWVRDYMESREESCRPSTLATYQQCLRAFAAWLEDRPLDTVAISGYLRTLRARKLSQDSQRNAYRMIKTFCRWLVEQELLDRDPFVGRGRVRPPALKRQRRKIYSEAEIVALLHATGSIQWKLERRTVRQQWRPGGPLEREELQGRALVLLAVDSALRAGEIAALSCGQIRAASLLIESKGGHQDAAFVSVATRAVLWELAHDRRDNDPLFRDWSGKRCSVAALRGILVRLARRAGVQLPPRPMHAFRHYAAREWLKASLEDLTIQQLMRHSQLSTTTIYTQLDEDELAELHAKASPAARLLERAGFKAA